MNDYLLVGANPLNTISISYSVNDYLLVDANPLNAISISYSVNDYLLVGAYFSPANFITYIVKDFFDSAYPVAKIMTYPIKVSLLVSANPLNTIFATLYGLFISLVEILLMLIQ